MATMPVLIALEEDRLPLCCNNILIPIFSDPIDEIICIAPSIFMLIHHRVPKLWQFSQKKPKKRFNQHYYSIQEEVIIFYAARVALRRIILQRILFFSFFLFYTYFAALQLANYRT